MLQYSIKSNWMFQTGGLPEGCFAILLDALLTTHRRFTRYSEEQTLSCFTVCVQFQWAKSPVNKQTIWGIARQGMYVLIPGSMLDAHTGCSSAVMAVVSAKLCRKGFLLKLVGRVELCSNSPAVLKWGCQLTRVDPYNYCKTVVVIGKVYRSSVRSCQYDCETCK